MRRTAATIACFFLAFGGTTYITRTERLRAEHSNCTEQRLAREQGNTRAAHLVLLEKAIVSSNEKAQAEIPSYTYPMEIQKLREEQGAVHPLPLQKC